MIAKETVIQIVEAYLKDTEHYLVDLKVSTNNRISVEIDHFDGVSIDFCSDLSRYIELNLDREIEDYELEVSSAGLTEPFKVRKQYEKNIGNEVEVVTKEGKKIIGILKEISEEEITIEVEKMVKPEGAKRKIAVKEDSKIAFNNIKTTKYIIRFK
ncbi:MAG: ribosome assembly cofactor RimP [Porphyromonadaceae bacterium]|jgi:ribosome maturation factor RimP|nr:ribosome assembly cofactor RimP [Porphyromonadaceae bacterium]